MKLDELIATRKPGYTLPAPFYLSQAVFEQDVARIFRRYWIFVGVEAEIAEAGDFFTVERSEWDFETSTERPRDLDGTRKLFEAANARWLEQR